MEQERSVTLHKVSEESVVNGGMVDSVAETVLETRATSAESDKVSDAIDEGRNLEEGNRKLERRLRVKKLCIFTLVAVILILLLKSCGGEPEKGKPNLEDGEYVPIESDVPHIDGYTAIPVIDDFEVSKSQPYASLYNPESNAGYSYLQYRFTDLQSGDVFYESGLVEPGKVFSVAFGDLLPAGEYRVLVEILNYDYEEYTERKNGGKSEITITVGE